MKKIIITILLSITIAVTVQPVNAQTITATPAATISSSGQGTKGNYVSGMFGTSGLQDYVNSIYKWAVALGAAIAVGMIIWGGYTYATSAGDIEKINNAKEKIVGAVIGLIILLAAFLILQSIATNVTVENTGSSSNTNSINTNTNSNSNNNNSTNSSSTTSTTQPQTNPNVAPGVIVQPEIIQPVTGPNQY